MVSNIGLLSQWKVLEEMIADFRKKGLPVPPDVMSSLKSARTMIDILKAGTSYGETLQRVEEYLGAVEAYLVSEGQKKFGSDYVDEWLKRLDVASCKAADEEEASRFVPGLPRGQKWIRVKPTTELPIDQLKKLAEQTSLSHTLQKDGYLLVSGTDENIKAFVKKMTTKVEAKRKK
jgi:hypothetical protein